MKFHLPPALQPTNEMLMLIAAIAEFNGRVARAMPTRPTVLAKA